jgi:YVTN family beta-propeller protein
MRTFTLVCPIRPRRLTLSRLAALCLTAFVTVTGKAQNATRFLTPTQSSSIAISGNDRILVNTNPEANSVSVFDVAADVPNKLAEIKVGREPASVAITPDGTRAFVANALDGTVTPVDLVKRKRLRDVSTGAEPMAVAISPNATRLYVANSASNTLSVLDITAKNPVVVTTVDLSPFGSAPRSIAVTNDGDEVDDDETVFVAFFFAGYRPGKTQLEEGQDDQREGRIVAIDAATNAPSLSFANPLFLSPMANTGFNSNGQLAPGAVDAPAVAPKNPAAFDIPTGAYPNQLASIAIHPQFLQAFVVSTAASPNGPLRFNHMVQGLVSVFDTATGNEIVAAQADISVRRQTAPLNLNQGINLALTPQPRLFLSNPVAITWQPNGQAAWVAVQNSNVLVRLTTSSTGVPTIGAPLATGPSTIVRVDLQNPDGDFLPGKAPRGIAINSRSSRAYVSNFVSRSISVIDLSDPLFPTIVGTALSAKLPAVGSKAELILQGAELFFTGRGPTDSTMSAESWGGCITCHPNGRSDNVTWMFEAGPRQTIPLDGTFDQKRRRTVHPRILNWSAVRDENSDFEQNTRGIFGGNGLIEDDRLFFIIGGGIGTSATDTVALQSINQFHQVTRVTGFNNDLAGGALLPELLAGRRDFATATLDDGRVFIIGGRTGTGPGELVTGANAILEFNPRTNLARPRSSGGFTPRHSLGAGAVKTAKGFRIYAIGGYAGTGVDTVPQSTVEEFDPATNKWRTVAALPTATAQFATTVAGGINAAESRQLIHVISGNAGPENAPALSSPALLQRFEADPLGSGAWTTFGLTDLTPRRLHGAAPIIRGVGSRIIIAGGLDATGTTLSSVEEYQAQSAAPVASSHTPLPEARADFGIASSLSTNQVYVFGGVNETGEGKVDIFEFTAATDGPTPGPAGTPSGVWAKRGALPLPVRGLSVSTPPAVTNFLPNRSSGRDLLQDTIALWISQKVRASRAPVPASDEGARRGRILFGKVGLVSAGTSCATCHGGPKWTRSAVDYTSPPSPDTGLGLGNERIIGAELRETKSQPNLGVLQNVGTFTFTGRFNELRSNGADSKQTVAPLGANGFNIPSLLSVHETKPYFYSGLARTLEEVFDGTHDGNNPANRPHFITDPAQRADLIRFLLSIDATTKSFP